jgi:hypothetical protein
MKKTFALLIIIVMVCGVKAQDIMITKDGQKITAKVEEIGVDLIKYKTFDNQTGPSYSIKKNSVASILYENGNFEVFPQTAQRPIGEGKYNYQNGKNLYNTGVILAVSGSFVIAGGVACYVVPKYAENLPGVNRSAMYEGGIAMMTIGSVATASGIICAIIGKNKMNSNGGISLIETKKYKLDMAIGGNTVDFKLKF